MENWVDFVINRGPIRGKDRNKIGLSVKIRTRRDVEEFISSLQQGRRFPVDNIADGWYNCNTDIPSLEVYDVGKVEGHKLYTLDGVGQPPLITQQHVINDRALRGLPTAPAEEQVNLSFLRLVGSSGENGITIGFPGAYSFDYIKRLQTMWMRAVDQFLHDYVVPITINLHTISKS